MKILILSTLSIVTLLIFAVVAVVDFRALGTVPFGKDLKRIAQSKNYDPVNESFVNLRPFHPGLHTDKSQWEVARLFFFDNRSQRTPSRKLPETQPNLEAFLETSNTLKFIWLGHSTFLLRIAGKTLLFDPVFSGAASPVSFVIKRFQKPVLDLESLPKIDWIIISHDHYDHLDRKSIEFFKDKETQFMTPLGVGSHLKGWGIAQERIHELDWWQKLDAPGLRFICTPAQHFSGRGKGGNNKTLWSSWVVAGSSQKIFYSGDGGYGDHFKEIGQKHGPFEIAFMENGQYNEMWPNVHSLPHQTAQAFLELRGKYLVPVHWSMFNLSLHRWSDPAVAISREAKKNQIHLLTPRLGQLVDLSDTSRITPWWEDLKPN